MGRDNRKFRVPPGPHAMRECCEKKSVLLSCRYSAAIPSRPITIRMGVEGYAGTPLFDSAGSVIGLMVVMSRRPLNNPELVRSIVQIFAVRASAELERSRIEKTLRERTIELQRVNGQLRREIAERTRLGQPALHPSENWQQALHTRLTIL